MAWEAGGKILFPVTHCFGSAKCYVIFIHFFHLHGGLKNGSLPKNSEEGAALRGIKDLLWLSLSFHFCSKIQAHLKSVCISCQLSSELQPCASR